VHRLVGFVVEGVGVGRGREEGGREGGRHGAMIGGVCVCAGQNGREKDKKEEERESA